MARRLRDAYNSLDTIPKWFVDNSIYMVGKTILEPCSGTGVISNFLANYAEVYINDIDIALPAQHHLDISKPENWDKLPDCDWVITNPPFNIINDFLPLAFNKAKFGMAIYARKSITEPCRKRQQFLKEHKQHLAQIIFCHRVSFTGDGKTDLASCDWYIWTKHPVKSCVITWAE